MFSLAQLPIVAQMQTTEISTVLMESTFRIEGPSKQFPGKKAVGTVFFVYKPIQSRPGMAAPILVTAAHVLDDITGPQAMLQLRKKESDGGFVPLAVPIQIRNDDGKDLYTHHKEADVAAMFQALPSGLITVHIHPDDFADDKMIQHLEIHPGDEVLCLGFPFGLAVNDSGFPILRTGVISSYPLTPAAKVKYIGFDFRIFGGNSGGPVYFRFVNRPYANTFHIGDLDQAILGLVSLQVSDPRTDTPLSLARIVPGQFIKETIDMLGEYNGN